jgi:flavin reductase (DIM6/NTAB) family NADH-FMN oxidoreductase RutF
MQHFNSATIKSWERFYRANFINSLTGFKPVSLIGTVNKEGLPNLAIFSSIVHLGSDPALIGYINRPLSAAPHTIDNIKATGIYTINHILPSFVEKAHQTSAKYPTGVSEFGAVGLTSVLKEGIIAPFVAESKVQYALKLVEIVPIKHNNTFLVIGEITDVFISEEALEEDGFLALEKVESIACNGADAYYKVEALGRFAYAKAGVEPVRIDTTL